MTFQVRPLLPSEPAGTAPPRALAAEVFSSLPAAVPAEPSREERAVVPAVAPNPAPPSHRSVQPDSATAAPAPDAPYLPRGELTVPPRPLGAVDVPFPPDVEGMVDLRVRVTLFIDERGLVQRLRVETPDVHPAFERSIRDAFGQARFSPGELERVAVRSQLRLEVEFRAPGGRRRS